MSIIFFTPHFLATASPLGHFVKFRAFNRGNGLKEENEEAVCVVEELPFSQDTMDLASEKYLFFLPLFAKKYS